MQHTYAVRTGPEWAEAHAAAIRAATGWETFAGLTQVITAPTCPAKRTREIVERALGVPLLRGELKRLD